MSKKVLAVVLSVILMLVTATPVFAEAAKDRQIEEIESKLSEFKQTTIDLLRSGIAAPDFNFFGTVQSVNYSDHLTGVAKDIFDYFVNSPFGTYVSRVNVTYSDLEAFLDDEDQLYSLILALNYDCPVFFYFYYLMTVYVDDALVIDMDYSTMEFLPDGDISIDFLFGFSCSDEEAEEFENLNTQLWEIIRSFDFSYCNNRYELLTAFHDKICEITTYDPDFDNDNANPHHFDVTGCFIDGCCVCASYSLSFKLLCDYYGIPCVCIVGNAAIQYDDEIEGGGHAWNAVLMDDGNWYLVDNTWDDNVRESLGNETYEYFLVGSETEDASSPDGTFKGSHIPDADAHLNVLFSETAYVQTDANRYTRFDATHDCFEDDALKTLFRTINDTDEPVYFNGLRITEADKVYKTGDTIAAKSGEYFTKETWNLFYAGDPNEDLQCDAADYALFVNEALAYDGTFDEAGYSFDMNFDRSIDVLDVVLAERISNGYDI